jgi:DNA-binding GntR family transcriptional regulator
MKRIDGGRTIEEEVFEEVRNAILLGAFEPGARLRLGELADALGVSSLPVRAALTRLRAEGLVSYVPRSGSIVAPLEYEELEEIQALRLGIEGLAARLGAERVSATDVEVMRTRIHAVQQLAQQHDLGRYLRAEAAFRELCFRATGRDRLIKSVLDLRLRAERYLRVAFDSPRGLNQSAGFQRELLDACVRHDGDAAEDVTRRALQWTKEAMAEFFGADRRRADSGLRETQRVIPTIRRR